MSTVKKCHLRPILGCLNKSVEKFRQFCPFFHKTFLNHTPSGFLNKLRLRLDKVSKPRFRNFLLRATTKGSATYKRLKNTALDEIERKWYYYITVLFCFSYQVLWIGAVKCCFQKVSVGKNVSPLDLARIGIEGGQNVAGRPQNDSRTDGRVPEIDVLSFSDVLLSPVELEGLVFEHSQGLVSHSRQKYQQKFELHLEQLKRRLLLNCHWL